MAEFVRHSGGKCGHVDVTTAASIEILSEETVRSRAYAVISNPHASNILWLAIGTTAVVGDGIPVFPKTSYVIDYTNLTTRAINGIAETGTVKAAYQTGY